MKPSLSLLSPRTVPARKQQEGILLIEALFAIVVFSLGVLALVGFQASAIRASAEARSRSDATLVASQIISDIWAGNPAGNNPSQITGASLNAFIGNQIVGWRARAASMLPQSALPGGAQPLTITVSSGANDGAQVTNVVAVTVKWLAPGEAAGTPVHSLTLSTQIN
jgi:type IV pilus assembly protein PilV